jgi:hypothetical protein
MAKSSSGNTPRGTGGVSGVRRTPGRRRTDKNSTGTVVSSAPDRAPAELAEQNPSSEEVRRRAYELYIRRGGAPGGDLDDWLEAERQLRHRRTH